MIKVRIYIILIILLCACKKNESQSTSENSEYIFPHEYISPKNNIDTNLKLSKEFENIIESLTNFEVLDQHSDCVNESMNICNGNISIKKKFFIQYNDKIRELSILKEYDPNCQCKEINEMVSKLETIPINKIKSIEISSSLLNNVNGEKLFTIFIYPKFNMEDIKYKEIKKIFDKKLKKYRYIKSSGYTKEPIIFNSKENNILILKNKIEKLVELSTLAYKETGTESSSYRSNYLQNNKNLPFIGVRTFSFCGGNSCESEIIINNEGSVKIISYGFLREEKTIEYQGEFKSIMWVKENNKVKYGYKIVGNDSIYQVDLNGKPLRDCFENELCKSYLYKD